MTLLDFGLIQRFDSTELGAGTDSDVLAGTIQYMAPEQATSGPVGPAADWYAVGVVLFEALTGTLPFSGQAIEVLLEKQSREPISTCQLVANVPADLDALTRQLLRSNPGERPGGAEVVSLLGARNDPSPAERHSTNDRRPFQSMRLVGRAREVEALLAGLRTSTAGEPTAILVQGEPGIGKTVAVERFLEQARAECPELVVLRSRCYEQETVPFNAIDGIIDALSHLLKRLDDVVAAAVLPPNIQVLADVFPVLRRVRVVARMPLGRRRIGNPEQLRRQAFDVLRQLLDSLANQVPLVLFIDDLQWADGDSLELIEELLGSPDVPSLLLVATMRSTAASVGAPGRLHESLRTRFRELSIDRLTEAESELLLARLFEEFGTGDVHLKSELAREAGGHPLFLQELVRYAAVREHVDPRIRFEDMLVRRVSDLEHSPLRLMEILAIAEVPLTIDVLSSAADVPAAECFRWVRTLRAVQLVRIDGFGADRTVQTFHDRIREAIVNWMNSETHTGLTAEQLQDVHLRIGRHLLQSVDLDKVDRELFNVVHHLNVGEPLMDGPDERRRLIELNVKAGRLAVYSTAYQGALQYFHKAATLLHESTDWASDYELRVALYKEWIAGEHLAGHVEQARMLYDTLLERARTALEKADVLLLWTQLATSMGRFKEAIETGRSALRLLDMRLPTRAGTTAILTEHARIRWLMGRRRPDDLAELPETTAPRIRMIFDVLVAMGPAAFFVDVPLLSVALLRVTRLTLKHGICGASPHGFCGYGMVLSGAFGKHQEAYAFGQLALRLNERYPDQRITGKMLMLNGTYLTPWVRPFSEAREQLDLACASALREGDLPYESYAAATRAIITYCDGGPLDRIRQTGELGRAIAASRREHDMSAIAAAIERFCIALRDSAELVPNLSTPGSSDDDFRESLDEARMPIATLYYFLLNAELAYGFGDAERASGLLREAAKRLDRAFAIPSTAEYCLLEVLVAARLHDTASWRRRVELSRAMARSLKRLDRWAKACGPNFEATYLLAVAEKHRVAGRGERALQSYDAAAGSAREHGHPKREALALELAARFCLTRDPAAALAHASEAIEAYERWGATAKAAYLRRSFEQSLGPQVSGARVSLG